MRPVEAGWRALCGASSSSLCPNFVDAYDRYALAHPSLGAAHPSSLASLTIDDAWVGEGLGFISGVSAQWLLLAMATGRALFLDVRSIIILRYVQPSNLLNLTHSSVDRGLTSFSTSRACMASIGARDHRARTRAEPNVA